MLKPSAGASVRPKLSVAEVEKLIAADSAMFIIIAPCLPSVKNKFLLSASNKMSVICKLTKDKGALRFTDDKTLLRF
jgi:hypothetical protein